MTKNLTPRQRLIVNAGMTIRKREREGHAFDIIRLLEAEAIDLGGDVLDYWNGITVRAERDLVNETLRRA